MLRKAFVFVLSMLFLVSNAATSETSSVSVSENSIRSPLGVYDTSGELLFSLGSLRSKVEGTINSMAYRPRLLLDADEIANANVLSAPIKPTATGSAAYQDVSEALIAAAPTTLEEIEETLSVFGLDVSILPEITHGLLSEAWIKTGVMENGSWSWEDFAETYTLEKEIYELKLEGYELDMVAYYAVKDGIEDVRNSLTITDEMISVMVSEASYESGPRCIVLYADVPEIDELRSEYGFTETDNFKSMLQEKLKNRSFSTIEERNLCIEKSFNELMEKYTKFYGLSGEVRDVFIYSFGFLTEKGEYVGMPVESSVVSTLDDEGKYSRYYTGDTTALIELSAAYIQNLASELYEYISPLYCVDIYVSSDGYIHRIELKTLRE